MTFGEIKTAVVDWLAYDSLASMVPTFIKIAQLWVERNYNLIYMQTVDNPEIVDDYYINLPSNYKSSIALHVIDDAGRRWQLQHVSAEYAWDKYPYDATNLNRPKLFSNVNGFASLLVRPTPDSTYTWEHRYYKYSAPLSADSDTNWLTDNAYDVLIFGALVQASPYLGEDNRIESWANTFTTLVSGLVASEQGRFISGSPQYVKPGICEIV